MFSLTYTSAYDPYHTIFRFICILRLRQDKGTDYEVLRYADFYLCFPWLLSELKADRSIPNFQKLKNALVRKYAPQKYDYVPSSKSVFMRMEPIQLAALSGLLSSKIVERSDDDSVRIQSLELSEGLSQRVSLFLEKHDQLLGFLTSEFMALPYLGGSGLKARSGLEEYRYDNI